jgi:tRNA-dihydrouridine synthase B
MDEIQLSALKYIVSYAYEHTLFYKKLYNNIDISSLSSIEELPIVTTELLKKYPHEFKTDEPIYKVVMTSGTLSNPKILYRTQQDFEKSVDNECLLLNWAGIQKNDIVCIIQPFGINGYGELTLEACKKLGIFAIPLGDVQDDIVLAAIKTFSPTVLDISPSRLLTILPKIKPEKNFIRLAMVAGECITPNFKSNIFRKYGIQIINQYGSTELDGLAAEKINEEGLHLIPNSFIFEIVDDQIVVTSLYHKGTPLIRYMLGDIATINNNIIEVCGRNASIQLMDGIILEQSIIDNIVAKYNGLFWQCILYNNKNTESLLEIHPDEQPVSLQFFGSDPKIMSEMAKRVEERPFDIMDINMGCPVPKVVRNGEGSALMKNPKLVYEIVSAMVKAIDKPVTVKIRKGFDDSCINAVEIAKIIEEAGAAAVAVHGRTREQYYSGQADWDIIRQVKEAVSIPVIGNGDVTSPQKAEELVKQTGCDGIMIARGAQGNPWIFSEMITYEETSTLPERPGKEEVRDMMLRHARLQLKYKGEFIGIREMRKHVAWYTKGLKGSAKLREEINRVESYQELEELLFQRL